MYMRKIYFAGIAFFAVVLFINGILVLRYLNGHGDVKFHYGRVPAKTAKRTGESGTSLAKPVNVLILGMDEEGERSDCIVLLNYNENDGGLNILSIARDTRVLYRGRYMKINALVARGGEKLLINKVREITGISADYYITLDFNGFRELIDALEGVEMNVPFDMDYDDPEQNLHIHLQKGWQVLNGQKAEQFVRYRKGNRNGQGYIDGDIGRIKAQQEFIKAFLEQKLKLKYLTKAGEVFYILRKHMRTNIEPEDISYHFRSVRNISIDKIRTYTTPGDSGYIDGIWYFFCDGEKTRELVDSNFFK